MRKLKGILALVLLLALLASPIAVLASNISGAKYYGTILVSNSSTATTNVAVNCTISTSALIDSGYLNSSANNCVVRGSAGADLPFMPGVSDNPWCIWVPSIGENSHLSDILYTANSTGGEIRYFPAAGGMTTADNTTIELGDNFTLEQKGWINTDNGSDKNLVYKTDAFRTYVSDTVSGNITSVIFSANVTKVRYYATLAAGAPLIDLDLYYDETWNHFFSGAMVKDAWTEKTVGILGVTQARVRIYNSDGANPKKASLMEFDFEIEGSWQSPTGHNDPSSAWADEPLAYDDDTGTLAFDDAVPAESWSEFLELTHVVGISVTAPDVSSGEHTIKTIADGTFFYIEHGDITWDNYAPAKADLILNAPMWHTELDTSPFITKDVNEHTGTISGATWTSDGYSFDGNDKLDFGTDTAFNAGTFSIETWIYPTTIAGDVRTLAGKGLTANLNGYSWHLEIGSTGKLTFHISTGAAGANIASTDVDTIQINNWYHIVATYDRATTTAFTYINGVQDKTSASMGTMGISGTWPLFVGYRNHTVDDNFFIGTMGEIRMYDLILTEVEANYNATKWKYDGSDEYFEYDLVGTGVPDNSEDWTFCQNDSIIYLEHQDIEIDGVEQQRIEWEYNTTFTDLSGQNHDATPTFRTTSSDEDVSAVLTGFLPISEAKAPAFALEEAPAFIETVPEIVSTWVVTPGAGTFPLAGVIRAIAAATDTPAQLPLLLTAAFVILACSLAISATMRRYGSGSLIVKSLVITALMGVFIALGNFGIDFWMLVVFLIVATALMMASRHTAWQ